MRLCIADIFSRTQLLERPPSTVEPGPASNQSPSHELHDVSRLLPLKPYILHTGSHSKFSQAWVLALDTPLPNFSI